MQVNTNVYAIAKVNSQWMKEEDSQFSTKLK